MTLSSNFFLQRKRLTTPLLFIILLGSLFAYGAYKPGSNLFGPITWHGPTREKAVAFTFDDGPHPLYTKQVLDILRDYNVRATFFLLGKNVEKYPEIAELIVQAGHIVGNHTFSHATLDLKSPSQITAEIKRAERAILNATGVQPMLFRPPRGYRNPFLFRVARKMGYTVVGWSADPKDWSKPGAETIIERVLREIKPGAIVLLHDGSERPDDESFADQNQTVAALPPILEELKLQGYQFVTIPELLKM